MSEYVGSPAKNLWAAVLIVAVTAIVIAGHAVRHRLNA